MSLRDLQTMDQVNAEPRAPQKGVPRMLTKKARQQEALDKGEAFRKAVWNRDNGCSRATGRKLVKSGTTDWALLGEVDHSVPRSLAPDRIYDVSNGILLSKEENRLRKIPCPRAPEYKLFDYDGPDDRREPQTFIWLDLDGKITNNMIG